MFNPFKKRASEYMRDGANFLAFVTPEPLFTFVQQPIEQGTVFDRLVTLCGTPGSGKTTIAALFRYTNLRTILRAPKTYRDLLQAMTMCRAIEDGAAVIAACRIPMEAEYRDIWELPYPEDLKSKLLFTLIQARAVLLWAQDFASEGEDLAAIGIERAGTSVAAAEEAGLETASTMVQRAREIEAQVYRVTAALVPPPTDQLGELLSTTYRPFDVLSRFLVGPRESQRRMLPLVVLDDAHALHPVQLKALTAWLMRRELGVARWLLTRVDALDEVTALAPQKDASEVPGVNRDREMTTIWLQNPVRRGQQRRDFRVMARRMSELYIQQMPVFARRSIQDLESQLDTAAATITPQQLRELKASTDQRIKEVGVSPALLDELKTDVESYAKSANSEDISPDLKMAMLRILVSRIGVRQQRGLFDEEQADLGNKAPKADSSIAHGARVHLLHRFNRPLYYGFEMLGDAAGENAEQFLKLAANLVDIIEHRVVSNKGQTTLDAALQNKTLREAGTKMIDDWNFPQSSLVKKLIDGIAVACVKKSLEDNASLGGGANAFAVPQDEYFKIPKRHPKLALVLKYAIAYNACNVITDASVKNRTWCVIQLGGAALLKYGLTLQRGGHIDSSSASLARMIEGAAS